MGSSCDGIWRWQAAGYLYLTSEQGGQSVAGGPMPGRSPAFVLANHPVPRFSLAPSIPGDPLNPGGPLNPDEREKYLSTSLTIY